MAELTPMMQQYVEIKGQYKDCILFYRLGDFYEMFFEDAVTCAKELEITLTGKNVGQEEKAPMCGIPYHAVDNYLSRLIAKGYKVAICEQVEDPKASKGIVKREVIRIVTPGTNLNAQSLEEGKNNFLMGIVHTVNAYGIATVDITTGDFFVTEVDSERKLIDEINKYAPSEIICNSTFMVSGFDIADLRNRLNISISDLEPWYFEEEACVNAIKDQFKVATLGGLGLGDYSIGITAAGAVMLYLHETQKNSLSHLTHIIPYVTSRYMILDSSTRRNLELVETLREKQKRGSLLWVLDKTKTAMGARLLRSYIEQPLIEKESITDRLDALEELNDSAITREEIREYLNAIYDLERLISRISYKSAGPRDLIAFKNSLSMIPPIKMLLETSACSLLKEIFLELDTLEDLYKLIDEGVEEEPPIAVKEGGIIKDGYHEDVDKLRKAKSEGKNWLADLETRERDKTGIKNLKIKFNRVFGYYLEVTNSYQNLVPENWIRKQTLANAERYTTPELKELEDVILGAEDKLYSLEYELFSEIRDTISKEVQRIQRTAKGLAKIDVYTSLAYVSERNRFIRPVINEDGIIDIKDGRHPVVEQMISGDMFVANDTYLNNKEKRISIITGPNMAGKSTYMRQTALIVLMAQIGCFIPASYGNIGIADRIFTRVGASDDLASGQSTFMVEMTEVANILRNATKNSLLILDEIGRGTSTFDGLGIAWAVVEHIANPKLLGAKTLFATHYHELTELEGKIDSVNNYCIAVKEQGEDIIFLRKIISGGADKSYGIQVAKLAGVPDNVLKRARDIVDELSLNDITDKAKAMKAVNIIEESEREELQEIVVSEESAYGSHKNKSIRKNKDLENQISLFDYKIAPDFTEEIKELNINVMTPVDALNYLYKLQEKVKSS